MRNFLLLLCASASIAYSRPNETSGQIQQRFGKPLMERVPTEKGSGTGSTASAVHLPPSAGRRIKIGNAKNDEPPRMRYVSRPHFTPSMREASFLYKFGKLGIAVHFFNDRSQREEYTGGLKPEDIDKILTAASNGVEWAVALHEKGSADYETERAYNEGKSVPGHYKANGLRAWIDRSHGKLIVETDAFRELRLAEEAKKPQPGVGQPIPGKGKGI